MPPGRVVYLFIYYLLPCEQAGLAGGALAAPAPGLPVPEDTN